MADSEMTDANRAYAVAEKWIAEALAEGATELSFDRAGTRALEVLPPEIAKLDKLEILDLNDTQVSDLVPLSGLSGLQRLYLNNTQVSDLVPLSGLSGLQVLYLNDTQVSDLVPLSGLSGLQTLYLTKTQVRDLRPIRHLTGLLRSILLYPVTFQNSVADVEFPEIDELYQNAPEGERVQALFDFLETWVPPEEVVSVEVTLQGPILTET